MLKRILIATLLCAQIVRAAAGGPGAAAQETPPSFSFHHLHLNGGPAFLLPFYERLFDPSEVSRVTVGGVPALKAGLTLLVAGGGVQSTEGAPALWHFGWGTVSLGETYLAHARVEVAWDPPLPAGKLHLHLRSVDPVKAAAWYHTVLGLRFEMAPSRAKSGAPLPPPEHRMPEALLWLGDVGVLIYRSDPPLVSSRGHRIDHLAIVSADVDAALDWFRAHDVRVLAPPRDAEELRVAMIEGPDAIPIELVEVRTR